MGNRIGKFAVLCSLIMLAVVVSSPLYASVVWQRGDWVKVGPYGPTWAQAPFAADDEGYVYTNGGTKRYYVPTNTEDVGWVLPVSPTGTEGGYMGDVYARSGKLYVLTTNIPRGAWVGFGYTTTVSVIDIATETVERVVAVDLYTASKPLFNDTIVTYALCGLGVDSAGNIYFNQRGEYYNTEYRIKPDGALEAMGVGNVERFRAAHRTTCVDDAGNIYVNNGAHGEHFKLAYTPGVINNTRIVDYAGRVAEYLMSFDYHPCGGIITTNSEFHAYYGADVLSPSDFHTILLGIPQPSTLGRECEMGTVEGQDYLFYLDVFQGVWGISAGCVEINDPPVAACEVGLDEEGLLILDGTGSYDPNGTIVSYVWTIGDTEIGTGAVIGTEDIEPGIYDVTLTVTDNGGLSRNCTVTMIKPLGKDPALEACMDAINRHLGTEDCEPASLQIIYIDPGTLQNQQGIARNPNAGTAALLVAPGPK